MTSHNENDTATGKKLADMFLADFDNLVANSRPSTAVPSSRIRAEKPSIDSYGVSDKEATNLMNNYPIHARSPPTLPPILVA